MGDEQESERTRNKEAEEKRVARRRENNCQSLPYLGISVSSNCLTRRMTGTANGGEGEGELVSLGDGTGEGVSEREEARAVETGAFASAFNSRLKVVALGWRPSVFFSSWK